MQSGGDLRPRDLAQCSSTIRSTWRSLPPLRGSDRCNSGSHGSRRGQPSGAQPGWNSAAPRRWQSPLSTKPKSFPPFSQHSAENLVHAVIKCANNRISALGSEPQHPEEQRHRNPSVLPAVQPPLAGPVPIWLPREWAEIINGPDVLRRRPARADEIAQQVQVKNHKRPHRHTPAIPCKKRQRSGSQHGAEETMKQPVMVIRVEKRLPAAAPLCDEIDNQAQAVRVRQHAGPRDEPAVSRVARRFRRDDPTRQQVRFWRHRL